MDYPPYPLPYNFHPSLPHYLKCQQPSTSVADAEGSYRNSLKDSNCCTMCGAFANFPIKHSTTSSGMLTCEQICEISSSFFFEMPLTFRSAYFKLLMGSYSQNFANSDFLPG